LREERDFSGAMNLINGNGGPIHFGTGSTVAGATAKATILANGNFLIGQTSQVNPAYILDVLGNARVNEVVVNTSGADFVFDKHYKLPKLSEVKTYIDENHHLPEIPSAEKMKEGGLHVGEINTKLLQKVEEMTLYLIDQQKQLAAKDERLNRLQTQVNKLQKQIATLNHEQ
jgi:hypothetical protein